MKLFVAFLGAALVQLCLGSHQCETDTDCSHLGTDIVCVKSACDVGVCGCPFGTYARFCGTYGHASDGSLFKCVAGKKVGEACNDNKCDVGFCAAPGSYCDVETHTCKCQDTDLRNDRGSPRANNQYCLTEQTQNTMRFPGEDCTITGSCVTGYTCQTIASNGNYFGSNLLNGIPTKQCLLVSPLFPQSLDISYGIFASGNGYNLMEKIPIGRGRLYNDFCQIDTECGNRMKCVSDQCKCDPDNPSDVPNYEWTQCGKPFGFGTVMQGSGSTPTDSNVLAASGANENPICNGDLGLIEVVGTSYCQLEPEATDPNARRCACGPQYIENSGVCTQIVLGSPCKGHINCIWADNGKATPCISATCQHMTVE